MIALLWLIFTFLPAFSMRCNTTMNVMEMHEKYNGIKLNLQPGGAERRTKETLVEMNIQ